MSDQPATTILPPPTLGRVLLFTGGDCIASLVKWQSRSHYSHVALLIPGTNTVIESYPFKGVRKRELTAKDWDHIHAYEITGMTARQWDKAIQFCESQLGKGYDWRNVFRFISRVPARENDRWFCSEIAFRAIEEAGLRLLNMAAHYVNPGHIPASTYARRDEAFEAMMAVYYEDES